MSRKKVIHIGLVKSASTFLQRNFFGALSPEYKYNPNFDLNRYLRIGNLANHDFYDLNIFSDERIIMEGYNPSWGDNLFKLRKIMGRDCKIILILRNQYDLLDSWYAQSIHQMNIQNVEDFMQFDETTGKFLNVTSCALNARENGGILPRVNVHLFDYNILIDHCFKLFGPKNCLILFYEDLKKNQVEQIQIILDFLEISRSVDIENKAVYRSLTRKSITFLKFFYHLVRSVGLTIPYSCVDRSDRETQNFFIFVILKSLYKIRRIFTWVSLRGFLQQYQLFGKEKFRKPSQMDRALHSIFNDYNLRLCERLPERNIPAEFFRDFDKQDL